MGLNNRVELHNLLKEILGSDNVYFSPPATVKMKYPCIVYHRNTGDTLFAGNKGYRYTARYQVTYIDSNPDNDICDKLVLLPMCVYDRHYTADNLNHDVFNLYY